MLERQGIFPLNLGEPLCFWIPIFENQSDQSVHTQDRIDFLAL